MRSSPSIVVGARVAAKVVGAFLARASIANAPVACASPERPSTAGVAGATNGPAWLVARALARLLVGICVALGAVQVFADEARALHQLNDFRSAARRCGERELPAAAPLRLEPRLSALRPASGEALKAALAGSGFATVQVLIARSGSLDAAVQGITQRYCAVLLDPAFTAVGISTADGESFVVLGKPVVPASLPAWPQAGREVLAVVNRARAVARQCGDEQFDAAPPLVWDERLAQAALAHSRDMAERNYFDHFSPEGGAPGERVRQQGYRWRAVGENLAAGHDSAETVVAGWLKSPPHCANIMSRRFRETGVAYAVHPDSDRTIYWAQTFAAPR